MSRDLSQAELAQRRLAPLRHGAYARSADATKPRDYAAQYRARKLRRSFPHLQAEDDQLLLAAVRFAITADGMFAEIRNLERSGKPVPPRLRTDWERLQRRATEYLERLRARDTENAARSNSDPEDLMRALVSRAGGES